LHYTKHAHKIRASESSLILGAFKKPPFPFVPPCPFGAPCRKTVKMSAAFMPWNPSGYCT